jgi:hypothetical protein
MSGSGQEDFATGKLQREAGRWFRGLDEGSVLNCRMSKGEGEAAFCWMLFLCPTIRRDSRSEHGFRAR